MRSTRFKVVALGLLLLLVAQISLALWLRGRRHDVPLAKLKQTWQPLAERTSEDRAQLLASAFALADFDVKPLETESKYVTIPRPKEWLEQAIASTSYANAGPAKDQADKKTEDSQSKDQAGKTTEESQSDDAELPWRAGAVKLNVLSIAVSEIKTVPAPKTDQILIKENIISRDAYATRNGISVPVLQLLIVGRYYVDQKENTLLKTTKATQINGRATPIFAAEIPQWLLPNRKFALGETWTQVGCHPEGVPDTAPRSKVVRTLKRLVLFESRRAAEIFSASTVYDFVPGPKGIHVKRQEDTLTYVDLETGEPLWYEVKATNNDEFVSVIRGCNQIFRRHLIRVPQSATPKPKKESK